VEGKRKYEDSGRIENFDKDDGRDEVRQWKG